MTRPQIVIDTNVLIAALRSRWGASFRVLELVDQGLFEINLSVSLVLEYEDVAKRQLSQLNLTADDVDDIIDYLCLVAHRQTVYYLWRPTLSDPKDDMVLELAVVAGCDTIVTHNIRDFEKATVFGIRAITPRDFLHVLEKLT
jgi:putative PIN family toxin of toxin-antitoxin system